MDIYDPIGKALGLPLFETSIDPNHIELSSISSWNSGKTARNDPYLAEVGKRISESKLKNPKSPWNKGLTSKQDPRIELNSKRSAETKKKNGFYDTCKDYLPVMYGDKNPMKRPEQKQRMSALAKLRYRVYNQDGSWNWGYRPE